MSSWSESDAPRGADYDRRWAELAAAGEPIHGEADLVSSFAPRSVLDAGCGTGRVAIELARRGIDVVGVDLDGAMLGAARAKAPELAWIDGDLATVSLDRTFDVVVLAGNVMIFLSPGTEQRVVSNMARHLAPGGRLVTGFTIGRMTLAQLDTLAAAAGLRLAERWATWEQAPYDGGPYAVSVHTLDS